jgi:RimJ/RimL family protein N-acetyltransferase
MALLKNAGGGGDTALGFIRPDNHASKRVAERLGAVYEGAFESRGSTYEHWVHHRTGSS